MKWFPSTHTHGYPGCQRSFSRWGRQNWAAKASREAATSTRPRYAPRRWRATRPLASRVTHGGFTLKTHQMFSVHTPEKFENPTITVGHFGFVFEENSVREITTPSCSKCFLSTLKRKARVFKLLRFEERFQKAVFWWRISVDGSRLTVEIKLRFQNSPAKCGGSPKIYHYSLRLCVLKINEIHQSCVSFKPLETKRKMPSLPFNWQGVPDRTIVWLQKKIRTRREQKNDLIHWAFRRSVPWQFQYWRPRPELTRVLHCNKVLCCYYSKLTRSKWIIMSVL